MKKIITCITAFLSSSILMTSCLYEEPETTADGENGVDPTEVTVKANINLNLQLPSSDGNMTLERPLVGENPKFRHRFVIEAFLNDVSVDRQIIYKDIIDGQNSITLPVSMKLHARDYKIAVWTDYVQIPDEANGITGTEEFFYDTTTDNLQTVLMNESYKGNNEYKDALCGVAEADLKGFRDNWGAQINLDINLKRPVARYELKANDVAKFLENIASGTVKGTTFTVRLKYNSYLNTGYNVLKNLPRNGLMYMQYEKTLTSTNLKSGEDYTLAFDYVFALSDKPARIPVTLEIIDTDKKNVASTSFNIVAKAGVNYTFTKNFLTAGSGDGVHINPDYSGETETDIPGTITGNKK